MKSLEDVLKCFGGADSPQMAIEGIPHGHSFRRAGTPHYFAFYEENGKVFHVYTEKPSKEELLEKYNNRAGKEI